MPIKVQKDLPAKAILEKENIFIMAEDRAMSQDIRPLEILILNLMPVKEDTETQLLRALSNTPLQVDCTFLMLATHTSKNTSASHLNKFYVYFDEIKNKKFDGMIITGAPVENLEYEEVNYWEELQAIMEWGKSHVTSTLHICWGAQAGLYYHYGIPKYKREKKLSGIYRHKVLDRKVPLVRSMDDFIMAPHSRYTEVRRKDIEKVSDLVILAEEETNLFKLLFINDMDLNMTEAKDFYHEADNEKRAALFSETIGVELERAKVIFLDLFLYTHGIAVLTAAKKISFDRNHAEKMLMNLLTALIHQEKPDAPQR